LGWLIAMNGGYQSVAAVPDPGTLDEILVTSQRREENLQTVPIAISTLSGSEMEKAGIHELGTLAERVPGLTFSPFFAGQNIVSLRGVSSNDDGPGTDSSVAVFVDDVYLGRIQNINPEMFDVDRVEVLRGPQGTLYGKNTIGGAINVLSSRPNTEQLDVQARAEFGNYERRNFDVLISGPLAGDWAAKLAVSTRYAEGWVDNVVLHEREKDDNDIALRSQLLRAAGDSEILISVDYQRLRIGDNARIPLTQITGNLGPLVTDYDKVCGEQLPFCAANPTSGFVHRSSGGVSLKATQTFGDSKLVSITAFRRSDVEWASDSVGVDLGLSDLGADDSKQYTQELRWISHLGNAVNYVAGLWFMREYTDRLEGFMLPPTPLEDSDRYRQINQTTSVAGFTQADWRFAEHFTFSVGGRYSYDRKAIRSDSEHGNFVVINADLQNQRGASWDRFTPKATLQYQPTQAVNLYATFAQGFKSGGFASAPTQIQDTNPLKPERANNFEIGAKTEWGSHLRANLAVFETRYKDLQIQSFGPPPGCVQTLANPNACFGAFETFNAGSAEARGAELELTWLASEHLDVSLMYGYLDAKFTSLILPNADFPQQSGQDMFRAPRNKASLHARYLIPLGSRGTLESAAGYSYTSNQRGEIEPYAIQPAFGLFDARLAWMSASNKWNVALWGRNLADKTWVAHIYTIAGEVIGTFGDPRTYGVTVNWRY
jgi:iron complex outermembrane receptor protein